MPDPHAAGPRPDSARPSPTYPGELLGLPEEGRGAMGTFGRRLIAIFIDWVLCSIIAAGFLGYRLGGGEGSLWPLAVFAVENLLLVSTLGSTIGHRVLGLRVIRLDGHPAGLWRALVRTVLVCLVIPALILGRDGRGWHDKAAGTLIVRL
ncbi:RDD family protein [Segeticoccus rhizosphaerae]|uniref:RDD family protein n=1 Tax=Segeticoccus rhizosphaerae TaxID=1104777 RepID=UPI001EE3F303|nr:RDD family protein [Ornithinicoccus soli]